MARWFGIGVLLVAMALMLGAPAFAQEKAEEAPADEGVKVERTIYEYDSMGRRDPFISLIRPAKDERTMTGNPLLDNDVSQMRVIAIVSDSTQDYALFGLPDGKYYTVQEGMKIGLHGGHIEEISEDSVLIIEQKPDFRGDLRPVDTYIRLRKEEGQ